MTSKLTYLFDPLCGWCYGASPALQQLAQHHTIHLELAPTGLFSGAGGRVMDAGFAAYAWSNDTRIQKLTGQRFTEAYRAQVLGKSGVRFDSAAVTLALTAVSLTEPQRELSALKLLQEARYVQGQDTSELSTVTDILHEHGLAPAAERLLAGESQLKVANNTRLQQAQQLMQTLGVRGVPALVLIQGGKMRLLRSELLFGKIDTLLAAITA
ncbi:DsbA family protein [Rhodoferax sp. U11-2br]|uniref:DsbA family protein n=1 Tax=Rhodoferax sp. U11-2br TaxID=2838878 RepID=UPI001BE4F715|nr:DsbA family protein [Rhodoferax sp. U11-2br]MBT3069133.1 DsbA family protein [Rhodoferax sp. U11-2br]